MAEYFELTFDPEGFPRGFGGDELVSRRGDGAGPSRKVLLLLMRSTGCKLILGDLIPVLILLLSFGSGRGHIPAPSCFPAGIQNPEIVQHLPPPPPEV